VVSGEVLDRGKPAYTLVIGTREWSSWSLRAYLALWATGEPFEQELVALRVPGAPEALGKASESGRVPALRIRGGAGVVTVWDSLAICETLAERHPGAGLWPADWADRARARSVAAEMHSGFPDLRTQLALQFSRTLPLPELRLATSDQIARVLSIWETELSQQGRSGGFLFGRFSIADCMFAPVVSRCTTYGVPVVSTVKDYMTRIWALPPMQYWLREARKEVEEGVRLKDGAWGLKLGGQLPALG
jgi:glutathione S-transferase